MIPLAELDLASADLRRKPAGRPRGGMRSRLRSARPSPRAGSDQPGREPTTLRSLIARRSPPRAGWRQLRSIQDASGPKRTMTVAVEGSPSDLPDRDLRFAIRTLPRRRQHAARAARPGLRRRQLLGSGCGGAHASTAAACADQIRASVQRDIDPAAARAAAGKADRHVARHDGRRTAAAPALEVSGCRASAPLTLLIDPRQRLSSRRRATRAVPDGAQSKRPTPTTATSTASRCRSTPCCGADGAPAARTRLCKTVRLQRAAGCRRSSPNRANRADRSACA